MVNKLDSIDTEFRFFRMEVLAGDEDFLVSTVRPLALYATSLPRPLNFSRSLVPRPTAAASSLSTSRPFTGTRALRRNISAWSRTSSPASSSPT